MIPAGVKEEIQIGLNLESDLRKKKEQSAKLLDQLQKMTRHIDVSTQSSNKFYQGSTAILNAQHARSVNADSTFLDSTSFINKNDQEKNKLRNLSPQEQNDEENTFIQIARDDVNTEVFSWGCDDKGQLGLGMGYDKEKGNECYNQPQPRVCVYGVTIKQIACGSEHAAFLTITNHIYTMGSNQCGQLGIRDIQVNSKSSPVLVEQLAGNSIVDLSCGGNHTVAVTETGEVYAWGEGRYGALGVPDITTDQYRPQKVIFQENANQHIKAVKVVKTSAGWKHTTFLDERNRIYSCGNNENGQLGIASRSVQQMPKLIENFDLQASQVSSGKHHTLILTISGLVYSVGSNKEGQLGVPTPHSSTITPVLVEDISHIEMSYICAGGFSASISKETGSLYLWGTGTFGIFNTPHRNGQLGTGDFAEKPSPQLMQAITSDGRYITQIACGQNFTLSTGKSTGLSVMDEQRMALEEKISKLQKEQHEIQSSGKQRSNKSKKKKSKKDDFKNALAEQRQMITLQKQNQKDRSSSDQKNSKSVKRSQTSSILKKSKEFYQTAENNLSKSKDKDKKIEFRKPSELTRKRYVSGNKQNAGQVQNNKILKISNSLQSEQVYFGNQLTKKKQRLSSSSKSTGKRKLTKKKQTDNQSVNSKSCKAAKSSKKQDIAPLSAASNASKRKTANINQQKKSLSKLKNNLISIQQHSKISSKKFREEQKNDASHSRSFSRSQTKSNNRSPTNATIENQRDSMKNILPNKSRGASAKDKQSSRRKSLDLDHLQLDNSNGKNDFAEHNLQGHDLIKQNTGQQSPKFYIETQQLLLQNLAEQNKNTSNINEHQQNYVDQPEKLSGTEQQSSNDISQRQAYTQHKFCQSNNQMQLKKDIFKIDDNLVQNDAISEPHLQIQPDQYTVHQSQPDTGQDQVSRFGNETVKDTYNVSENISHLNYEGGNQTTNRNDQAVEQVQQLQADLKSLQLENSQLRNDCDLKSREIRDFLSKERQFHNEQMNLEQKINHLNYDLEGIKIERNTYMSESQQHKLMNANLQQEVHSYRLKLQESELQLENLKSVNLSLNMVREENFRLQANEQELKRANQQIFDDQDSIRRYQDRIHELENNIGRKTIEIQQKDEAIRQIDLDVREMQSQIERDEHATQLIRSENDGLRRELDVLRQCEDMQRQLKVQYENERQMRINSEGDISRLREQLADQMASSSREIEVLRRALDDMKFSNEESIRQISLKNEEIETMMDQMDQLGKIIEKKDFQIADLNASVCCLEMKNRKLNETVNKAIYGKTQGNIDKTMDVLTRRGVSQDPSRIAKQQAMGINPTSDARLQALLNQTDVKTPEQALRQLEQKKRQDEMVNEAANARNPYNDPSRSTASVVQQMERMGDDGTKYRMPFQRIDQYEPSFPSVYGRNYTPAPGLNMTPLQADIHNRGINHENWMTPGSQALYPGRLGDQQEDINPNLEYVDYAKENATPQLGINVRMPATEEESMMNRAEAQMTSNMIKNSLAELREKLTKMKHNKEFVQVGIHAIDLKK